MASFSKNLKLVKELVLKKDEKIIYSLYGTYQTKSLGQDTVKNGIIVATETRIVFFAKRFTGYDSESFKFSNISSIESGQKFLGKTITFYASGNEVTISNIVDNNFQEFVDYVEERIGKKEVSATQNDNLSQIKQLKELLDMDAISQEEFDAKKKELLGM